MRRIKKEAWFGAEGVAAVLKNQVSIQITSLHRSEGNEEQFRTTAAGTCMRHGRMYYIAYTESEPAGTNKGSPSVSQVHTLLKLGPDKMEMKKTGAVQNHMIFEPGKRHVCLYRTPYGILEFEITQVSWKLTESPGKLQGSVRYLLRAGGQTVSACEMEIYIDQEPQDRVVKGVPTP